MGTATPLAPFGPYFEVTDGADGGPWRPLRELADGPLLEERIAHTAEMLRQLSGTPVETRVAASTMSLGLFARLVSPFLGATVLGLKVPEPTLDGILWQPVVSGPWPVALSGAVGVPDLDALIRDVIRPLADSFERRASLSSQILLGNVASAVFGAVRMVGARRPDLSGAAQTIAAQLLAGPLHGTGLLDGQFSRSSCCLYYRIPGGGYCGDCVLVAAASK